MGRLSEQAAQIIGQVGIGHTHCVIAQDMDGFVQPVLHLRRDRQMLLSLVLLLKLHQINLISLQTDLTSAGS